jgi:hypothetical protein
LTCSSIDVLPFFPGASTTSSPSRFVVEGVFQKSGVVHSFEMVDPVLFVFVSQILCIPDVFSSFLITSLLILSILVYPSTLLRKRIYAASRRVISRFVVTMFCCLRVVLV